MRKEASCGLREEGGGEKERDWLEKRKKKLFCNFERNMLIWWKLVILDERDKVRGT